MKNKRGPLGQSVSLFLSSFIEGLRGSIRFHDLAGFGLKSFGLFVSEWR